LRSAANAQSGSPAPRSAVGTVEETTEAKVLGLPAAAAESSRYIKIDRKRLRAAGFVPEETQDRRFADQYRRIKRPILMQIRTLSSEHAPGARLVMMASALPGDGKTFTTINLSLSIARERDVSILIMDADVAKPHISRIFGVERELGLLDALADESIDIESLVLPTDVEGLSILPAGGFHEAATELLASARMNQVITRLTARDPRRVVLLDSPPLLLSTESRAVQEAMSYVGEDKPLGLVLNQSELAVSEGYYGYGVYGDAAPPVGTAARG
jgi:Mrp family chromosome partitioning ATPase